MAWLNNDGLYVKFGRERGSSITDAGQYSEDGKQESIEFDINLKDLTESETIQNDTTWLPKGALISGIELEVVEAAATGVAIDVGTIHISRNPSDSAYTADPNGLLEAVVTAELTPAGLIYRNLGGGATQELPAFGSTGAWGDDLGTVTVAPLMITASRTTSTAFTAGKVRIRVYFIPNFAATNQFAVGAV